MKYYSQCGQDKLVDEIFRGMNYGYFVDIGASDGIEISNTYAFEMERNWDGLCIEPHSVNFEKLKKNRKCDVDNSLVLADGKTVSYTEFCEGGNVYWSGTTPDPKHMHHKNFVRQLQAESLYTIFERHHVPTMIHFMSLDVEGTEYDILEEYFGREYKESATQFHTRYILTLAVEHNFHEPARSKIRALMESHNFRFHKELFQDDFYVHRAIDILL
jgi:FkbM family methyltransferase